MFKLAINASGRSQGYYPPSSSSMIWAEPGAICDFTGRAGIPTGFIEVKSFIEAAQEAKAKRLYIQRSFALGDTLLAIPVVRALEKMGWECYLRASNRYASIMPMLDIKYEPLSGHAKVGDVGLVTDWLIERDHVDPELSKLHRAMVYAAAVGIDIPREEMDWGMDISRLPDVPNITDKPFVVFQSQGGNDRKKLAMDSVIAIGKRLSADGIKVYHIGPPDGLAREVTGMEHLASKLTLPQLFSLIARAFCVVTMDSAPLWISHFTTTPVIAILGPTSWEQRLTLHPLYPDGVRGIQLEKRIGCATCAERAEKCNGKMDCLSKADPEKLAETVFACVAEFRT